MMGAPLQNVTCNARPPVGRHRFNKLEECEERKTVNALLSVRVCGACFVLPMEWVETACVTCV